MNGGESVRYDIYSITCLNNGKIYFGRSQEIEKRWRAHRNMLRKSQHSNTLLQEDRNTYGEDNFLFEIIYTSEDLEEAVSVEQLYIDSSEYEKYNISDAKMGGDTFTNNPRSEETRKLKSINTSGKNNPMYGKPKTDYMIQKTREANSKPVVIDGMHYSSSTEASKVLGIGNTTICYRLKAKTFTEWNYA